MIIAICGTIRHLFSAFLLLKRLLSQRILCLRVLLLLSRRKGEGRGGMKKGGFLGMDIKYELLRFYSSFSYFPTESVNYSFKIKRQLFYGGGKKPLLLTAFFLVGHRDWEMGDSFGIDFPFFLFFSFSFLSSSSARTHSHMFSFLSIIIVLCSSLFFFLFYGENSIFRSLFFLGFWGEWGRVGICKTSTSCGHIMRF